MKAKMLEGKVAIVTGASRGIGLAVSKLFAEEGAKVLMCARRPEVLEQAVQEVTAAGGVAVGVAADVCDHATAKLLFDRAEQEFGPVDILINNAGAGDMYAIDELTDEHLQEVVELDLLSVFRACREAVQRWKARGTGVIINVSSVNSWRPICGPAYTSCKAAVNMLTTSLTTYLSKTDIRVNCVLPGTTDTDAAASWADGTMPGGEIDLFELSKYYFNATLPMTRPLDQAYACLYLASDMGVAVRGQMLQVCNGAYR